MKFITLFLKIESLKYFIVVKKSPGVIQFGGPGGPTIQQYNISRIIYIGN